MTNSHKERRLAGLIVLASLPLAFGAGGCAWLESIVWFLDVSAGVAQLPAEIRSLSADPQELTVPGIYGPYCVVTYPSVSANVRWDTISKRIELLSDGRIIHLQDTADVRDTIAGEARVPVTRSPDNVISLRAYNALDQMVEREITVKLALGGPQGFCQPVPGCSTPPCVCTVPPCMP